MSFAGDLEHLPIVDVIQLLHATKKSGTLYLRSEQGESQLIFSKGSIVSACHPDTGVRIGRILVDAGTLSQVDLDQTLAHQQSAAEPRQPLIALLIESGKLDKQAAYQGLELLIELTIVEVLSWDGGTFTLDVDEAHISLEYATLFSSQQKDFQRSTQNILMDALRIFDERRHGGAEAGDATIDDDELEMAFGPSTAAAPPAAPSVVAASRELTVEDLGLDILETLERKIPAVFTGIRDYDPTAIHRKFVRERLHELAADQQERLLAFLLQPVLSLPAPHTKALILYGRDEVLQHVVMTVCKRHGLFVFATDDESSLELILTQSRSKNLEPVLVFSPPEDALSGVAPEVLAALRRRLRAHSPELVIVQLVTANDHYFALQALSNGVRTVFPLPLRTDNPRYGDDLIALVEALIGYLDQLAPASAATTVAQLAAICTEFARLDDPPEVALRLLRAVAADFPRALTLIVSHGELLAECSFGCRGEGRQTPSPPLKFRIPLGRESLFDRVIARATPFFGPLEDALLNTALQAEIGAPADTAGLLLPLVSGGRVVALIYGDFGLQPASPVPLAGLELLARHAGLVLESAAARKREKGFEKSPRPAYTSADV